MTRARLEERTLRHEAHDLAPGGCDAVRRGLESHGLIRAVQRRPLQVNEIHRDLCLSFDFEPERLHVTEAAGGESHRLGDLARHRQVRSRAEVDVERHEKGAGSDRGGASGRVNLRVAEIRLPLRVDRDLVPQALELSPPHVGEVHAVRSRRRPLVEVDWNTQLTRCPLA